MYVFDRMYLIIYYVGVLLVIPCWDKVCCPLICSLCMVILFIAEPCNTGDVLMDTCISKIQFLMSPGPLSSLKLMVFGKISYNWSLKNLFDFYYIIHKNLLLTGHNQHRWWISWRRLWTARCSYDHQRNYSTPRQTWKNRTDHITLQTSVFQL